MGKAAAVILAAGEGKRMKSDKSKVLHEVLFKPMIDWVMDSVTEADIDNICVVLGHNADQVSEHLNKRGQKYTYVLQEEQLGTGHAVMQAREYLEQTKPEDVLILNGDTPFIDSSLIKSFYLEHKNKKNDVTILTSIADNPFGYGRIVRDSSGNVKDIIEEKDATDDERKIKEINAGAYWFKTDVLLEALSHLNGDNAQHEYYLTDTVKIISGQGLRAGTCIVDMKYTAGANSRKQLLELNNIARQLVFEKLFDAGVTITDISGVSISPDAEIGYDTVILPGTIIKGKTKIGIGCQIGPNSLIDNSVLGDNVVFNASQARNSKIGNNVTVGPFSQLRPDCVIAENVHIGDFVEVKNSNIGCGTKIAHLTYVGDSDVGGGVNFGCGVVTVNYDGVKKSRTIIGDNAFIGCNTNLIAPVKVGNGAYTAAGSTITMDIPDGALSVARSRQQNIDGWAEKKLKNRKK